MSLGVENGRCRVKARKRSARRDVGDGVLTDGSECESIESESRDWEWEKQSEDRERSRLDNTC